MKIAITARGQDLDARIDPRFGRCEYFLLIDPETMEFESVENGGAASSGGSGIQAGQLMARKDVRAVLTGHCGPNAFQTLSAAGIDVFTGQEGTIREAMDRYTKGQLTPTTGATVDSHFGMGRGSRQ